MKYQMFEFFYNREKILFGLRVEIISSTLKRLGMSESELEQKVFLQNLGITLYKTLKTTVNKINFINHFEADLADHSYPTISVFLPDYNLELEMILSENDELNQDFLMLFHAKQLKLENINNQADLFENFTFKFNQIDYTITLNDAYYHINHKDKSFFCLNIKSNNFTEKIYVSSHIFTHIMATYYGSKFPIVTHNKFAMDSAICALNMWLSTFKSMNLKIIDWDFLNPTPGIYQHCTVNGAELYGDILLFQESKILSKVFRPKIEINLEDNQNKVVLAQDQVSFPVFNAMYDINKEQLDKLTVNASIFNLSNKLQQQDTMVIEIGNIELLTQYRDNKLYILDKREI